MFLKQIDLTTALRPSYLPDEDLLFVQDNVGLYEGKYKLPNQQNGQVYLTSHRICFVNNVDARKQSVALDLRDVERYEFYAGFLKSSAKITVFPKPSKRASIQSRSPALAQLSSRNGTSSPSQRSDGPFRPPPIDPTPASTATWVCTICSFSNPVPSNFVPGTANAHTPLPPCLACGIKPTLAHVLKASISNATSRQPTASTIQIPLPIRPVVPHVEPASQPASPGSPSSVPRSSDPNASFECPRCTFLNHPSLLACEMCGAPLISQDAVASMHQPRTDTESPGPFLSLPQGLENPESVKFSFRGGGEKIFYERLKGSMTQRKWLLEGAPPIPKSNRESSANSDGSGSGLGLNGTSSTERVKIAGIAGLEHRGKAMRKNNELVIGSAFEDLEALMASAKEIVALAERFAGKGSSSENAVFAQSASQLGLITTKDIVGGGDQSLYLSELSRNLAEFLTDDARGVLRRAGGIISLVDLWAVFNRARGGVELVSPLDLQKAANLWERLKLPVRLRAFKSGVLVVQGQDRTDETTIRSLTSWLADLQAVPPEHEVSWDWMAFGRGITAQDAAERFGWSIGVAEEELEMAEQRGVLCREEGIEGVSFWRNYIDTGEGKLYKPPQEEEAERITRVLQEAGFI